MGVTLFIIIIFISDGDSTEYRNDMNSMAEKLETVGAHYVLVDPFAENGIAQPHCFVAAERVDPVAEEAFKKLTGFLKERIYKEH